MKKFLILYCFIFCIGCKKQERREQTKEESTARQETIINGLVKEKIIIEDTITKVAIKKREQVKKGFEICEFVDNDKIPFEQMMITEELITEKKLGNRFYRDVKENDIRNLFKSEYIKCVNYTKANGFYIYKFNYQNKDNSLNAYTHLKQIDSKENNITKYDYFFKRGLIFILEKEKLIMISFNPFSDNNLPKKIKTHFLENEGEYDKVLMFIGIDSVEELID